MVKKITMFSFLAVAVVMLGASLSVAPVAHATGCVSVGGAGTASGTAPARIDLGWTAYAGADHYVVLLQSPIGGTYSPIGISYATSYSDRSGLSNGSTYTFMVEPAAVDGSVLCQSNPVSITVPVGRQH